MQAKSSALMHTVLMRWIGKTLILLGLIASIGSLWSETAWALYAPIYQYHEIMRLVEGLVPYYPFVPYLPMFLIAAGAYLIAKSSA
ncbi:MAG: hypothetical protein O2950_08960 [Proteobacteria bacterium]|mgnify:CR=1 FL=1|jgi:hypothetical protein|uniref:Uncharacterized protein n=1 Tax=SAR92 bacterium BACL26 MAG-121220-bin70 TaxID=1655626 RepID=A0A0R2UI13_9GAMM|nr:MAG: hypothetical protein ABS24_02585 [SAR92 bacterium BACL26 MAG-121220-bin70]MDA0796637.1 hypothetical protein [Pseudomonadota bacterium]MDA1352401.1 hypothetical protein [Pseudomonadota bacterium]|tara:strand:- start:1793 stop:2050 length:258 start_codon:yes stop_codon:yes gene_type:complete